MSTAKKWIRNRGVFRAELYCCWGELIRKRFTKFFKATETLNYLLSRDRETRLMHFESADPFKIASRRASEALFHFFSWRREKNTRLGKIFVVRGCCVSL